MGRGLHDAMIGLGLLAGVAPTLGAAEFRAPASTTHAVPQAIAVADTSDSVYTLPPVRVEARRILPETIPIDSPGQVSRVALQPLRIEMGHVADALERLPGLSVHYTGSVGHDASVSIRGSGSSQVRLYLDGVPLSRAGLGLTNLAELPFSSLDHLEVYRGFAPPGLPGSTPGGAIQLVTPRLDTPSPQPTQILAAAGSFGSHRLGWRQEMGLGGTWRGLFVVDGLRSNGDFTFHDDHGTPRNPDDDVTAVRLNSWVRSDEIMAKAGRPLPRNGRVEILHQWVGRSQGVPGYTSVQSLHALQRSSHHLTHAQIFLPSFWSGRLQARGQVFYDWRRDEFLDEHSEIGLGYQDNRDVTSALGSHWATTWRIPSQQRLALHLDARRESFLPWRRFPAERLGPEQRRTTLETTVESSWVLARDHLQLQGVLRFTREEDRFRGDLRTAYSRGSAPSEVRHRREPRLASRLKLLQGVSLEASYGEHHRSPGFLELFGDGGSVAGSADLVSETGVNRDIALEFVRQVRGLRLRSEITHYRNRVDHLITFLPQSQRTFVARNIGAARLEGEELQWWLGADGAAPRWCFEGNYTQQRTEDLGVDIHWYAGKALPGRPARQLYARLALRLGAVTLGSDYRFLGQNFLDRWNRDVVEQRDLYGLDLRLQLRALQLRLAARNLGNDQARDVAGFPVPGRTFSLGSEMRF